MRSSSCSRLTERQDTIAFESPKARRLRSHRRRWGVWRHRLALRNAYDWSVATTIVSSVPLRRARAGLHPGQGGSSVAAIEAAEDELSNMTSHKNMGKLVGTPRRRPAKAKLIAESRHLLYDIQMFGHTNRLLETARWHDAPPNPELPTTSDFDENIRTLALIESHLTHARSLMRFLWPTPGARPSDMRAADYLRTPSAVPDKWPEFASDLGGIDKEIAHLTYLRPPKPTQWDINNKLTPRLIPFVLAVERDRVQDGFKILAYAALVDTTDFLKTLVSGGLLSGRISG
jgi:hypothetical protein